MAQPAAAFLSRDFLLYQIARVVVIIGAEAQALAVAWQVYQITHKAIDLGYTGLVLFLPGLLFILPAGHIADRFDRRRVILTCYTLQAVCSSLLFWFAWIGIHRVGPVFAVLFVIGTGRAFSGPASSALVPHLVPTEHFVNAITWGATIFQIANFAGPALGGILFTLPLQGRLHGASLVYLFTCAAIFCFLLLVGSLHVRPGRMEHRSISKEVLLAGFRYVARHQILLGSISLDLFAVLLGGAVALMPIFAQDILHAGPRGLGMLRAAPALGALTVSLWMMVRPIRRQAGVKMLVCVAIFGASTILFGVSRNLPLSLAALFVVGASDMVSVVIRSSVLQLATPAEMRGRVSAVNSLFVGASNEFGEFESGLTAQWWGAVRAVIYGGIGSLAVTGLWAFFFPALRRAGALTPEALMIAEAATTGEEVRQR
ncbi:MAG TPA: MFS transporter [Acidobacteriaceae bacterium]|jgi:MFS family permease|nr:MFS transporter [Acidobacteriaceae bacterium]